MIRRLYFIVNPISGKGKHTITEAYLAQHFPTTEFSITVAYTEHARHAIILAEEALKTGPDCIIACGGDGTINEVASCLVNTTVKLGIVPVGSGNGLAANLNIPKDIEGALAVIRQGSHFKIDVGQVNSRYFFSNMGLGIDAMIIKKYEASEKRTLPAYVRASLASATAYKAPQSSITYNGKKQSVRPFLLFVSNSNEMGYNMSLTPKASLTDGKLDLLIVPELSFAEKLLLGYYVLRNKANKFRKAQHDLVESVQVVLTDKVFTDIQIDGESHNLKTNAIDISIIKNGLRVLVPTVRTA